MYYIPSSVPTLPLCLLLDATDDNAVENALDSLRKRSILRNDDWKKVANETKLWIPLNLSNFVHKDFKVMLHGTIRNDDF